VWGAISGLAAATGVFLGGVLTEGPGWRWVLLVNVPVCVLIVIAAFGLLAGQQERPRLADTDGLGAVLVTGGMLLLIYALVRAPEVGWGSAHTIGELATAGLLLAAFVGNELRHRNPLFPFGILRIKGLAAANATQLIAFAGFVSTFFFLTLYMQNALGWTPVRSGSAYLPVTAGIALAAGLSAKLHARLGARPIIVTGALLAAAGIAYLARVPLPGTYLGDLLPGLMIMSVGLGAVFVTVTTAANASVPADRSGLAAGLLNTSLQLGSALGLAIFSALATARTTALLTAQVPPVQAMTAGFHRALLAPASRCWPPP
jgi:MFS family permease